jgi:hypothetical protein
MHSATSQHPAQSAYSNSFFQRYIMVDCLHLWGGDSRLQVSLHAGVGVSLLAFLPECCCFA